MRIIETLFKKIVLTRLFKETKTSLKNPKLQPDDIGKFFAQKVHNIHANLNNTTVVGHFDDVVSGNKVLFSDFKELSIDVLLLLDQQKSRAY